MLVVAGCVLGIRAIAHRRHARRLGRLSLVEAPVK